MPKLCIDKCPAHGYFAVSISDGRLGRRLTASKCCGRWETVREWSMSPEDFREIAATLIEWAGDAEREGEVSER